MDSSLRKLFVLLLSLNLFFVAMHYLTANMSQIIAFSFDLDKEANVPTWYSSILLFCVALSGLSLYVLEKKDAVRRKHPWDFFWICFAAAYCFFSLDEVARLHELIDKAISVKWIYFYAPFAGTFFIFCAIYFIIIRSTEKNLRNWIIGGLIIYAVGGLGFEAIDHIFRPLPPVIQQSEFAIEEGLEMIGTTLVLMGCLAELKRIYVKTKIDYKINVTPVIEEEPA